MGARRIATSRSVPRKSGRRLAAATNSDKIQDFMDARGEKPLLSLRAVYIGGKSESRQGVIETGLDLEQLYIDEIFAVVS